MDMSEYKNEFISEARDHLDTLNEGLLELEKDSSNQDNINKLFRAFHTLKGNSAAMGFMKFSELAHSLEDILSKVRDKEMDVNSDVMDLLFRGCDLLESGLDIINNTDKDEIDVEGIIQELKDIMGIKEESFEVNISENLDLNDEEKKKLDDLVKKKYNFHRLIVIFDKANVLKSAKALVMLRDVSEISEIIKTTPVSDDIKQGKFEQELEFCICTKKSDDELHEVLDKISGVSKIFYLSKDDAYEKPEELQVQKKEEQKAKLVQQSQSQVVKQIQSVKVDMKKLDKLMNLVGELLISNIRLQEINKNYNISELKTVLPLIDRLTLDLQDEIMEVRMVPIGNIFNRFPRMVRDLATKEDKVVNFVMEGQEIEFDRTVLDEIGDPIVHLLRNSVDHGIESSDERLNAGKSETGTIKLVARREKNNAVIEVSDDGYGIDAQKVKESSVKKGMITQEEADKMSEAEIQRLIFRPGISTNKVVTDVSGRGVGMDVVESKIKELGGSVKLDSKLGEGTKISMQLPLTVAIITSLLVKVRGGTYVVPLSNIEETIDIDISQIRTIKGNEVFLLRNSEIALFWLSDILGYGNRDESDKLTVVVINRNGEKIGLVVDEIKSQQQVLIKGLQDIVKGTKGVAGATILGDGSVALILDVNTLLN
jgi:two-component system chemotaxis sensor kinase CheA